MSVYHFVFCTSLIIGAVRPMYLLAVRPVIRSGGVLLTQPDLNPGCMVTTAARRAAPSSSEQLPLAGGGGDSNKKKAQMCVFGI